MFNPLESHYIPKRFTDALKFVSYPFLDPDRPRFLNDGSFAVGLMQAISSQCKVLNSKFNAYDQVYESYSKWDDEFQTDLSLPGFEFTNKQMFWISLVHSRCFKKKEKASIYNVWLYEVPYRRSRKLMKQAFGCETYPGFQKNLVENEPKHEFVSSEIFEKLGLIVNRVNPYH